MYKKAQSHFKKHDPKLHKMSLEFDVPDVKVSKDLFRDITWTIIGQQLSGKAADTIYGRFKELFPKSVITPEKILKLNEIQMRGVGLSGAKGRALRDLSEKIIAGSVNLKKLPSLPNSEVLEHLMSVKGIGPWTVEMLLMFSLGREDVFSMGDLVLRKEIMNLHGWKTPPNEKKIAEVLKRWSPYRTYAARILWRIADSKKNRTERKK